MSATYPLGIKRFTTKRDLLDDVDASHINDIQDEITAIEDMLGPNPHHDNNQYDPAWRWSTLKARLEFMIRGKHLPCWDFFTATAKTFNTDTRSQITFPAPDAAHDTHGLFSNSTVKAKRAGWYHVEGRAYFGASKIYGNRVLVLKGNRGDRALSSQMNLDNLSQPDGMWVTVSWNGYMAKGDWVGLYSNITTGSYANAKYTIDNMALNGFMIRDA